MDEDDALLALFGDLVGGADIDELVEEFDPVDPNETGALFVKLRPYFAQALLEMTSEQVQVARALLQRELDLNDHERLARWFGHFLFPFSPPDDVAAFFRRVLDETEPAASR